MCEDKYLNPDILDRAIKNQDISPILVRYGTWVVTEYGIECLDKQYAIDKSRVQEEDWSFHMGGKGWVNMIDFNQALNKARKIWSKEL